MTAVKLRRIGNSVGVVLPKDVLAKLRVGEGDAVHLTETPDGWRLTAHDPDFQEQMALGEDVMSEYRNTLRALAK